MKKLTNLLNLVWFLYIVKSLRILLKALNLTLFN